MKSRLKSVNYVKRKRFFGNADKEHLPVVDNLKWHHAPLEFSSLIGNCDVQLSAGVFSETKDHKLHLDWGKGGQGLLLSRTCSFKTFIFIEVGQTSSILDFYPRHNPSTYMTYYKVCNAL